MSKIYLVEDEEALNNLLVTYLTEAGYEVVPFTNGSKAKAEIGNPPDLWVLDIMLPEVDGYTLIREIKERTPDIPVIFMSARSAELDRVLGLEMGSDDYLPKPFLPRELVLRVKRLLKPQHKTEKSDFILVDGYSFDRNRRVILHNDNEISLSVKEYDILDYLVESRGKARSRNDILDRVWGEDYFGSDRVVDDTLRRIRKKCPEIRIENLYGYGYILKQESDV